MKTFDMHGYPTVHTTPEHQPEVFAKPFHGQLIWPTNVGMMPVLSPGMMMSPNPMFTVLSPPEMMSPRSTFTVLSPDTR